MVLNLTEPKLIMEGAVSDPVNRVQKYAFKRGVSMQARVILYEIHSPSLVYKSRAHTHPAAPLRAVIKRATGLNDLYCHIGAFIMTLDRPPPPSSSPLKRILRARASDGPTRRWRSVCACKGH